MDTAAQPLPPDDQDDDRTWQVEWTTKAIETGLGTVQKLLREVWGPKSDDIVSKATVARCKSLAEMVTMLTSDDTDEFIWGSEVRAKLYELDDLTHSLLHCLDERTGKLDQYRWFGLDGDRCRQTIIGERGDRFVALTPGLAAFAQSIKLPKSEHVPEQVPNSTALPLGAMAVYISYAWGDDRSKAGRQRGEVVERLCHKLKEWGYEIVRDKNELRNGDLVSKFMRQIGRGERVLVILSKEYLLSPNCMTELYDRTVLRLPTIDR